MQTSQLPPFCSLSLFLPLPLSLPAVFQGAVDSETVRFLVNQARPHTEFLFGFEDAQDRVHTCCQPVLKCRTTTPHGIKEQAP